VCVEVLRPAAGATCVPLGRELSRRVDPKPKPPRGVVLVVFHMLLPQGDACEGWAGRSASLLLSAMPPRLLMVRVRPLQAAARYTRGVWRN
jgi:hypothetical protein